MTHLEDRISRALTSSRSTPSPDLFERVLDSIDADRRRRRTGLVVAASAAVVVAVLTIAVLTLTLTFAAEPIGTPHCADPTPTLSRHRAPTSPRS